MKAKCTSTSGASLPQALFDESWGMTKDMVFPLIEGKEYNVYAMTTVRGYIWYYICDEAYTYYPTWRPSQLFSLSCPLLSRYWSLGYDSEFTPIIAFKEWSQGSFYYENLLNGDDSAVAIFQEMKSLMDIEADEMC
jgi:hypothetical protein